MKKISTPPFWFLALLLGLPLFSETVYSPALPNIAHELNVSEGWVEHTLTIYLFGFALGILLWGSISDRWGRKPSLLAGLGLYMVGCIVCWMSSSLELLMVGRLIQALGGGACSVLGQSICRDIYQGAERAKAYALIGFSIPIASALGPVVGGFIAECLHWKANFVLLTLTGSLAAILTYKILSETHQRLSRHKPSILKIASELIKDPQEVALALLIGSVNGMIFSYYAEGPFCLINLLGMSPSTYGLTFLGIALFGIPGRYVAHKLSQKFSPFFMLKRGVQTLMAAGGLFITLTLIFSYIAAPSWCHIGLTLSYIVSLVLAIGMILPNALALALTKHKDSVGTASSLFGAFYYSIISLVAMGMGTLHNNTLFPMPIYFCVIGLILGILFKFCIEKRKT